MRLALMVATAAVACGPGPDRFPKRFDRLWCKEIKHCDPDGFERVHGSMGSCRDKQEVIREEMGADLSACAFDRGAARACLRGVRGLDCAGGVDDVSACARVYDCT